ncbi:MAG: hydrogenase expression/formation protein HypE [Bacillota bacterium]
MKNTPQEHDVILLSHGDGGLLTHQLLDGLFLPAFRNDILDEAGDSARFPLEAGKYAFSSDSFIVSPPFFPGGDIGKLAVCGTVNDLVVSGSRPLYLSASFIVAEGMPVSVLSEIVQSMSETARSVGVPVVTGDTKVVGGYNPRDIFINTTGIGRIHPECDFSTSRLQPLDSVIITGSIADHGAAILSSRLGLDTDESPKSDCAPLTFLLEVLSPYLGSIRFMRDPTRGGLATCLKELVRSGSLDILLVEDRIPVSGKVRAVTDILGVDPLYLPSEGRAVIVAEQGRESCILDALRQHPLSQGAEVIGHLEKGKGNVYLKTNLGGTRPLQMLVGNPLPRIC